MMKYFKIFLISFLMLFFSTQISYGATNLGSNISTDGTFTLSGLTEGSLIFSGSGGVLSQDNTNLFWNNTTKQLGIGTNAPESPNILHLYAPSGDTEMMLDSTALAGGTTMLTFRSLIAPADTQNWNISINGLNDVNTGNIDFDDLTAGTTPFTIQRVTGNVGIGTMFPTTALTVNGVVSTSEIQLGDPLNKIFSTGLGDMTIEVGGVAATNFVLQNLGGAIHLNADSLMFAINNTVEFDNPVSIIKTSANAFQIQDDITYDSVLNVDTVNKVVNTMGLYVDGGIKYNTVTAKPACDATTRGTTWFTQSGLGVKDDFEVCAKDVIDAYAWRTIY